jgi:hypothetical protein
METTRRATKSIAAIRSSLENAFFFEQDRTLIERRTELRKMSESKEVLGAVSGITNEAILERLVNLDVRPETLAALALVPLIEVVWADGEVDEKERAMVLAHATSQGIALGSVEYELLERWLAHRPEASLLKAWQHYVQGLCECLSPSEGDVLKEELMRDVHKAAEASGGFLGMGKISDQEREVLAKLESSFPMGYTATC